MNIPFVILMGMNIWAFGLHCGKHRQKKTGPSAEYNGWMALIAGLIEASLIYYAVKGGF